MGLCAVVCLVNKTKKKSDEREKKFGTKSQHQHQAQSMYHNNGKNPFLCSRILC